MICQNCLKNQTIEWMDKYCQACWEKYCEEEWNLMLKKIGKPQKSLTEKGNEIQQQSR